MKLVTGGTSRIGREIAKRLDDVVVHYYKNKDLAEELSPHVIQADLSDIKKFLKRLGKFDVIINNFAFVEDGKDVDSWERILRANVILPALLLDHIDEGIMINISSIMGLPKIGSGIAYGVSKAALNKFTDTTHKPRVRINAIAPAEIDTEVPINEIVDEVLRLINDKSINNQVIYLWGSAPESKKEYAI